jgi:hypothetical protein
MLSVAHRVAHFGYPCPDCRSTNNLHGPDCRFSGTPWTTVERAYVDVVSVLSAVAGPMPEDDVREAAPGEWDPLHNAALSRLKGSQRVRQTDDGLELLSPEEYRDAVREPDIEPIRTVYRKGSVPGAHDHSVFAMVAYYEMVGLSWSEARDAVVEWLHESGTWDRGGFEEETPGDLVDSKRHVYEEGYGWKQAAREAKAVIDRSR